MFGNTDNDWFDFLSSFSGIDNVNFWKPSPGNFKAISEGERFAFRLKSHLSAHHAGYSHSRIIFTHS